MSVPLPAMVSVPASTLTVPELVNAMPLAMVWAPVSVWFSVPAFVSVAVPVKKSSGVALVLETLRMAPAALISVLAPPVVKPSEMRSSPPTVRVP